MLLISLTSIYTLTVQECRLLFSGTFWHHVCDSVQDSQLHHFSLKSTRFPKKTESITYYFHPNTRKFTAVNNLRSCSRQLIIIQHSTTSNSQSVFSTAVFHTTYQYALYYSPAQPVSIPYSIVLHSQPTFGILLSYTRTWQLFTVTVQSQIFLCMFMLLCKLESEMKWYPLYSKPEPRSLLKGNTFSRDTNISLIVWRVGFKYWTYYRDTHYALCPHELREILVK